MKKELAQPHVDFLADDYRLQLQKILESNPIENLEMVKDCLINSKNSQLVLLIQEIIQDTKEYDEKNEDKEKWAFFDDCLCQDINYFQNIIMRHFFAYNILQSLLVSKYTPLNEAYRTNLIKKHNITPKKMKDLLLQYWGNKSFLGEIKHGGSNKIIDEQKQLELLATYNRYLIVIKNVRAEKRVIKKILKSEINAKKEALLKYEIPESLIDSAFSSDAPSEVALDWAKHTLKIDLSIEYLKSILNKIRKVYKDRGYIIDVDYTFGCRIYAFNPNKDKLKGNKLKYTPLNEPSDIGLGHPESFLVEQRY